MVVFDSPRNLDRKRCGEVSWRDLKHEAICITVRRTDEEVQGGAEGLSARRTEVPSATGLFLIPSKRLQSSPDHLDGTKYLPSFVPKCNQSDGAGTSLCFGMDAEGYL